jgi:hypothetical protein
LYTWYTMFEKSLNEIETLEQQPRSRETIQADLSALQLRLEQFDGELNPLRDKVEGLPEDQRDLIDNICSILSQEDVTDDELGGMLAETSLPVALEMKKAVMEYKRLNKIQQTLENEFLPYRKTDFEKLLREVSDGVNYDAVFDYYRSRKLEGGSSSDMLINTASQLYELRRFQHNLVVPGDEVRDFHYYDYRCSVLESFSREWAEKGFLRDMTSQGDVHQAHEYGEVVSIRRTEIVSHLDHILKQLEEFNILSGVYQHSLSSGYPYDFQLSEVKRVLNFNRDWHPWDFEGFENIDFDPAFLTAAVRHITEVVHEHRQNGHLPPTAEILMKERERIDKIEVGKLAGEINVEGFEAPDGTTVAVTPQEIIQEIRELLPPDFIQDLRAISHKKKRSERDPKDESNIETTGTFVPVFDEDRNLVAVEIEIYKDLFVDQSSENLEIVLAKKEFMGTVWHEFGHNAHHVMRFDEMKAWEQVMVEDQTAITWYVKYSREDNEGRGKREDFSESFRLFITDPALLYTLSPTRYQFMFDYFNRRLKTDQRQTFSSHLTRLLSNTYEVWGKCGYSQNDIKGIYLSHQKEPNE